MNNTLKALAAAVVAVLAASPAARAGILANVKANGFVVCGVTHGLPGFSQPDDKNQWSGLDVDGCRAVAAAVLGDASKVKYTPLNAKERFTALSSGEIDVLFRNTTITQSRDTSLGMHFPGVVNYYDGQGFLVSKSLGVKSALELDGAAICINAGTTHELGLADYFRQHGINYKAVVFDTSEQTIAAFEKGRCDGLTSDQSQLYALRTKLDDPSGAVVLPEVISKEPLGPVVRNGDEEWLKVVRWSFIAMLNAEELGITSKNAGALKASGNPAQKRLLGSEGRAGRNMGLSADWAYNIVTQVGNYSESFERNLGKNSPLKIARGLNALWRDGGLQYGAPIR